MRIIAAIDDGAAARPVLAAAAAVAAVVGATVEVVHVRASIGHGALSIMVEMASADDVVGVVVAARGVPGGEQLVGPVGGVLLTSLDKPILVVPPEAQVMTGLRRVLVPMEGNPATAHALRTTIRLAAASELEVVVLHVYEKASLPAFEDQPQYETEVWAAEFLARYVPIAPQAVRLELRVGVPAEQVLAVASEVGADLIALGWTQDLSPGRAKIVRPVIERSLIPVLLLPIAVGPGRAA
jgi:universal stress protein family protein